MRKLCLLPAFLVICSMATAQGKDEAFLQILKRSEDSVLRQLLRDPETFRVQIIYTQINRDRNNQPAFQNYFFHYDPDLYFNPASMVKFPLALLSLEKLNELAKEGVNKYTTVQFDSARPWQKALYRDATARSGLASIAHLIKRALLISENDPYNRMYQFVGQQEINRRLKAKGYQQSRITRQFLGLSPEQNRYSNPVRFLDKDGRVLHSQPELYNTDSFDFSKQILLGRAHMNSKDSLVNAPFDFTQHNNISLLDMQQMMQATMFPHSVDPAKRFNLTADDYAFLYRYLSQYPSETPDPKYDTAQFYDSYVKFFFRNSSRVMPGGVRVFNKVGWSYGFMTDVSYVADFENSVEFMLAATIYVNPDGVLNDGKYEYKKLGYPFFHALGQVVYEYELQRQRAVRPDLSAFRLKYEQRDPNDRRPVVTEVDN